MGFNCGIIGLPNVGKSTVFKALTSAKAEVANYPFCTIDPNVGVVPVPDPRLETLEKIYHPKKLTPTTVEVVDIAGLVQGASDGEGLGNKFLGHVREVDALLHVVRCFEDPEVIHTAGEMDPKRDIEVIETELILSDLEILDRRAQKIEKKAKSGGKSERDELKLIITLRNVLNEGRSLRGFHLEPKQREMIQGYHLLTLKPLLYVANISDYDSESENKFLKVVQEIARVEHTTVIAIAGGTEAELSALSLQEKQEFISELNLEEPGLNRLVKAAYDLLGLLTFFTGGEEEVRAWTVVKGSKAPQGAGKIHSDMERGFIRAEVIRFSDLCEAGSVQKVKEGGLLRLEGKDYVIQDGDIVFFRFHV
jgi:GTP-binding protein YchF